MEEEKQDGANSTEQLHTKGGYECTIMEHPKTKEKLTIRECFDRWQLVDDDETDAEHKMRKKLLNAFNKRTKVRGTLLHPSISIEAEKDENGNVIGFKRMGKTYRKNQEEQDDEESIEETILNLQELGAQIRKSEA